MSWYDLKLLQNKQQEVLPSGVNKPYYRHGTLGDLTSAVQSIKLASPPLLFKLNI